MYLTRNIFRAKRSNIGLLVGKDPSEKQYMPIKGIMIQNKVINER